jgi:hypothetical protein
LIFVLSAWTHLAVARGLHEHMAPC